MAGDLSSLEEQQLRLARVHMTDFRSANLWELVGKHTKPGSVLDVGCGAGGMVSWLLERGYDAWGIDSNEPTIDAGKSFLAQRGQDPSRLSALPLEKLITDGVQYDNVTSMDCLEHIEDDRSAFETLVRLLPSGGRLLVTVPALPAVYGERDRIIGHYRRYTAKTLKALTVGQPIEVEHIQYWNLLGVAPAFVSQRILGKAVDETFRYGEPTLARRALRTALMQWFRHVESRITPPLGLTVFMSARKL